MTLMTRSTLMTRLTRLTRLTLMTPITGVTSGTGAARTTHRPTRRGALLLGCAAMVALTGCAGSLPRDSQGTLDRATGGILHVGASENAPWTQIDPDGTVGGTEAELVTRYAESIDATIEWEVAALSVLAMKVENDELDLVIGGLTADTPWSDTISPTRPYQTATAEDGSTQKMVIGVRPGENALQVSLERFLAEQEGEL